MNKQKSNNCAAITGIGIISPLGISAPECWENLLRGKSGITPITRFDPASCLTKIGGQLPDKYFDVERKLFPDTSRRGVLCPARLSVACAKEAMADSGIDLGAIDHGTVSVIMGTSSPTFGRGNEEDGVAPIRTGEPREFVNDIAAYTASEIGLHGPSYAVATACASGGYAVGLGYQYVQNQGGLCLVIGVDTMLEKDVVDGFNNLMALTEQNDYPEKASRPFDNDRSGFVLSEGACALVLEPLAAARRRGARVYALLTGAAMTSDAYNIIAPEPEGKGMAHAMDAAIADAGIRREEIGYISAHGTSTIHNDIAETNAIKRVFGPGAYNIPISSQKSMIGHTIGAAGAIECAVAALSLHHGVLTPTINLEEPDPKCDLDYVPKRSRMVPSLRAALSNSFGFGGHNSTVVLERYGD